MFDVSVALLALLRTRSRNLLYVCEIYPFSYEPFPEPASGNLSFDPRHALKRFAGQNISFDLDGDTVVYERQVLEFPSIQKHISKQFDTATLRLSNVDRTTAAWVLSEKIQGMRMVIRMMPTDAPISGAPGAASAYADSIILFVGRVNKPGDFNRSTGTISATQDLGSIEVQIPPGQFTPKCPLKFKGPDCLGSELLSAKSATYKSTKICKHTFAHCDEMGNTEFFQGIRIVQLTSSFIYRPHRGLFTRIINIAIPLSIPIYNWLRRRTVVGNSTHDGTPYGQPISVILGRWKKQLTALQYKDTGETIHFLMAACRGTIHDFLNIRNNSPNFSQPLSIVKHKGEYGGVGTQTADAVFPEGGFFSKLAYITGRVIGSNVEVEDPAPDISSMIAGSVVRAAFGVNRLGTGKVESVFAGYTDGGGAYSTWSDNPVDQARFIITDPAYLALPESHIAERATARASGYTLGAIKDVTNAERCLLPNTETARAGTDYKRYTSTGFMGALSFRKSGLAPVHGMVPDREATYEFYNPAAPPSSLTVINQYRPRYRTNIEVSEQKKAIDFLYDVLFPAFRGFIRWDSLGRLAVDVERPADHSFLRADVLATNTAVKVFDVTPWKPFDVIANEPEPLRGKVLLGVSKLTSEVRPVSTANYSADGNAITLAGSATGAMSVVAVSGATFSGGSSTVPAQGTIEYGGNPAAGNTITATIDGVAVTIIATAENTDVTLGLPNLAIVEQLAFAINAEPLLNWYIEATAAAIVTTSLLTIKSKFGVLNLSTALAENHFAELDDPTVAPTLAASAGALAAGAYLVSYAYRNTNGNTNISPIAAITLTASQKIDVTAITPLPSGVTSVDWFLSVEANSGTMLLVANNSGAAFSINALPDSTDADVPIRNTTGEEIMRVMMSFAGKALTYADTTKANILDGSFEWPEGGRQSTVNQVKTKYREAIQDFAEQPLIINDERHQEITGKTNSVDIDLSAVDNYNQASRLCNGYLAKVRDADFFFKWGSAGEALLLEVGDVVCASDDSGAWRNVPIRNEDLTYNQKFEIFPIGRLYSSSQFDDAVLETQVPLPSALINYLNGPPAILFNTVDFPPDGLVQSTDGTAGITSIRGGAIFGASSYPQHAKVRLIKRAGVTVNEQVGLIFPDASLEAVFEFIASADGLYTVELEVCDSHNICNTTKPTASIIIGFGSLFGIATEGGILITTEGGTLIEQEH